MVRGAVLMWEEVRMGMYGDETGVPRGRRSVSMPSAARREETIVRIAAALYELVAGVNEERGGR